MSLCVIVGPRGGWRFSVTVFEFRNSSELEELILFVSLQPSSAFGLGCNRDGESSPLLDVGNDFLFVDRSLRGVIVAPLQPRSFFLLWLLEPVRTSAPSPQHIRTSRHQQPPTPDRPHDVRGWAEFCAALRREAMPPRASPFRFSPRSSKDPAGRNNNNSRANCSSNHRAAPPTTTSLRLRQQSKLLIKSSCGRLRRPQPAEKQSQLLAIKTAEMNDCTSNYQTGNWSSIPLCG